MVDKALKIVLFCRSLNRGGAERQIIYLAQRLSKLGHHVTILSLYAPNSDWYDATDLTVVHLNKKSKWDVIGFIGSYYKFLRRVQPDVIYSFLAVQNIIAALTSLCSNSKIICGVRSSFVDLDQYTRLDKILYWTERQLFRLNIKIITNSYAGRDYLIQKSPSIKNKISVVVNGTDFDKNVFSVSQRESFRQKMGIDDKTVLVGHVGRYDHMKDHKTLIDAAQIVEQHNPNVRFLCWGHGERTYTQSLKHYANNKNINVIWHYEDVHPCYSAFDIYCLTSIGEGHSNTLVEAMAHGIPCIATDVGDCKQIISDDKYIVPASSPSELAQAILSTIQNKKDYPDQNQVSEVKEKYTIENLVNSTLMAIK